MTLLLSHSQQLLNSQNQAYANLLCWRPPNLFNRLRSREKGGKKEYQNVERGCFFSSHFVLVRPHSMQQSPVLLAYRQQSLIFYEVLSAPILPYKYSPYTLPLLPFLSLWSVLQCLTQPLCWPQIQIQTASLAWQEIVFPKLILNALAFHKETCPGPVTSGFAWSAACMILRRGTHLCVWGQNCGQQHYRHVNVMVVKETALTASLFLY